MGHYVCILWCTDVLFSANPIFFFYLQPNPSISPNPTQPTDSLQHVSLESTVLTASFPAGAAETIAMPSPVHASAMPARPERIVQRVSILPASVHMHDPTYTADLGWDLFIHLLIASVIFSGLEILSAGTSYAMSLFVSRLPISQLTAFYVIENKLPYFCFNLFIYYLSIISFYCIQILISNIDNEHEVFI